MIILRYELRSQQSRTAVVPDDFDILAWKKRMVEDDLMTPKQAKVAEIIRVKPTE